MSREPDKNAEDVLERADAWDRCYPGNLNIELLVDDLAAELKKLRNQAKIATAIMEKSEDWKAKGIGNFAQAHLRDSTGFKDNTGAEIFIGDVVRVETKPSFQRVHGTWCDYEIVNTGRGAALFYLRSETGCHLPFGYTGNFMIVFDDEEGPDLKEMLWGKNLVDHPLLRVVECELTPDERRKLFEVKAHARRALQTGRIEP